jgi:hypothetical protein
VSNYPVKGMTTMSGKDTWISQFVIAKIAKIAKIAFCISLYLPS